MTGRELRAFMAALNDSQHGGDWVGLDALFASLDPAMMPRLMVIAALRSTAHAALRENRFSCWNDLVSRARKHYNEVDGSGDSALRGLY